jgi:hypothetical protein
VQGDRLGQAEERQGRLTITRAPAIKKIPATTATVGVALHLTITTTGYPAPALTIDLPDGVASMAEHVAAISRARVVKAFKICDATVWAARKPKSAALWPVPVMAEYLERADF